MPDEVDPIEEAQRQHAASTNGTGAAPKPKKPAHPTGSDFDNKGGEAHLLWQEILARGYLADNFRMQLKRLEPPSPTGAPSYPALDGAAVRAGADALYTYIVDYYHMPSKMKGLSRWEVTFIDKSTGTVKTRGYIAFPHQDEVASARPQVVDPYAQVGAPPPPWRPGAPQGAPQGVHYAAPPAHQPPAPQAMAPAQSSDPIVAGLQAQVAGLSGRLEQLLNVLGAPAAAPVAPAPPPPQASGIGGINELLGVVKTLRDIGLIPPAPTPGAVPGAMLSTTPVAAPPSAAPVVATPTSPVEQIVAGLAQLKALVRVRNEAAEVLEGLAGVEGGAPDPKEPEGPAGEAAIPWQRVQLGSFSWAIDKESGGWSPQGILAEMMNAPEGSPLANTRKTVLDLAGRLVNLGEAFAKKGVPGLGGGNPPPVAAPSPNNGNNGGGGPCW